MFAWATLMGESLPLGEPSRERVLDRKTPELSEKDGTSQVKRFSVKRFPRNSLGLHQVMLLVEESSQGPVF